MSEGKLFAIRCTSIECRMQGSMRHTEEEATTAWNSRAGAVNPGARIIELEALFSAECIRNAELTKILNTPEFIDFIKAVPLEAAHQVNRWGSEHDGGKQPQDWFWLIGYLAGKALRSAIDGDTKKALHHCISTAAVCSNWHAQILGASNMRPGIEPPP